MSSYINMEITNLEENLPPNYNEDKLVIMPRDPRWIFAYWDISENTRNALHQVQASCEEIVHPCLRVYRHTQTRAGEVETFFDLDMEENCREWYIEVAYPDYPFHVEWGWKIPQKGFNPIMASNLIYTPRDGISQLIDEHWHLPDWKSRKLYRRISLYHFSSPEFMYRRNKK